jgi:hypothetical protein
MHLVLGHGMHLVFAVYAMSRVVALELAKAQFLSRLQVPMLEELDCTVFVYFSLCSMGIPGGSWDISRQ